MHKKVSLIKRWIALVLVMALIFSVDTAAMAQGDAGSETETAEATENLIETVQETTDLYETDTLTGTEYAIETEQSAETKPASANETENAPETDMILETEAVYEAETVLETQATPDPDEPDPCDRRPEQENAMEVTGEDMVRLMAENREIKAYGIDVYSGDGTIDWQAVYDEGVRFAFIRCGYRGFGDGVLYKDDNFRKNAKGALAAGIQIGTYFFSTAITEAEIMEEARFVCEQIKDFDLTYPVAFDYEGYNVSYYRNYNISYAKRNTFAQKYLNYMQSQGYKVMLYSSAGHLRYDSEWNTTKLEQLYPIWVAQYWMKSADPYLCFQSFKEIGSRTTSYERSYKIWQFSEHGKLNGIKTYVDLNIEYLDPGEAPLGQEGDDVDIEDTSPRKPVFTSVTNKAGYVRLQWAPVKNAEGVNIYKKDENGEFVLMRTITDPEKVYVFDKDVKSGDDCTYRLESFAGEEISDPSEEANITYLDMPELVKAEAFDRGIRIDWKRVDGAEGYYIYRRKAGTSSWKKIATVTGGKKSYYKDTAGINKTKYDYTVRAFKETSKSTYKAGGLSCTCKLKLVAYRVKYAVNLRNGYGTDYRVAGTAYQGEKLYVIAGTGKYVDGVKWFKIYRNDKYRYVCAKYIRKIR